MSGKNMMAAGESPPPGIIKRLLDYRYSYMMCIKVFFVVVFVNGVFFPNGWCRFRRVKLFK